MAETGGDFLRREVKGTPDGEVIHGVASKDPAVEAVRLLGTLSAADEPPLVAVGEHRAVESLVLLFDVRHDGFGDVCVAEGKAVVADDLLGLHVCASSNPVGAPFVDGQEDFVEVEDVATCVGMVGGIGVMVRGSRGRGHRPKKGLGSSAG